MQSFSKVIDILAAATVFFMIPLLYFGIKQEQLTQLSYRIILADFLEVVSNQSEISEEVYLGFEQQLTRVRGRVMIKISVIRTEYEQGGGMVEQVYETDELLDVLNSRKTVGLRTGDFVSVCLEEKGGYAVRMMSMLTGESSLGAPRIQMGTGI